MRVVVALSGGVDSSVAAALLAEAGHEVIAVTLQLADLSDRGLGASRCCSAADVEFARAVCARLGVPHYVLDMEEEFRRAVLDPFVESYLAGETPLPCARCNSRVKFGELLRVTAQFGAAALASGHYARVARAGDGEVRLLRGLDRSKDQSYFLFELTSFQLESVLFPLGGMTKAEVRRKAQSLGLPNAARRDSQEVCFVPAGGSYADVLERLAPERLPGRGEVVDRDGTTLGAHDGFHRYTIGQRRGIGVPGTSRRYVVGLEPAANRVVVGPREHALHRRLGLREVNWLASWDAAPIHAEVQIRSRHEAAPATVTLGAGGRAEVEFDEPVLAPAPGQAAVCYAGERVLGGGWIAGVA